MGILFKGLLTAGSMTQTRAPTLMTLAEAFWRIPAKMEVNWTMRNMAKVMPTIRAANLALSLTKQFKGDF